MTTSRIWKQTDGQAKEVEFIRVSLDVMTGERSGYSLILDERPGATREAPSPGFHWKHDPAPPESRWANDAFAYFVEKSESGELFIVCALAKTEFDPKARLVAFDDHGRRYAMAEWGGELFKGIMFKTFRLPKGVSHVSLVGLEQPNSAE